MGRRLWSPYTRKRNDACRRTASRTPSGPATLRDTLPREHFFASFSSTAHLELGLWRNVEGRHLTFLKLLARGRLRPQQQVLQTKACEPLTTLLPAELIQFGGRPCRLVVAEDITILQRVEEARFALAQRLIFANSVNGPFLEVTLQEIAYERTNIICAHFNCR
jgi:hypothetical protein